MRITLVAIATVLVLAFSPPLEGFAAPMSDGIWIVSQNGESYVSVLGRIANDSRDPRSAAAGKLLRTGSSMDDRSRRGLQLPVNAPAIVASVNLGNPNSWRVSGNAIYNYWQSMIMIIDVAFCSSTCTTTDHMQITSTVNPGTTVTRINTGILYFPNAGNILTRRWYPYAICSGIICGTTAPFNNNATTIVTYVYYSPTRSGGRPLTIALGVQASTTANTVTDGSKTADCYGGSGGDTACYY